MSLNCSKRPQHGGTDARSWGIVEVSVSQLPDIHILAFVVNSHVFNTDEEVMEEAQEWIRVSPKELRKRTVLSRRLGQSAQIRIS